MSANTYRNPGSEKRDSSTILVDVAQFFPSLDHQVLLNILRHYKYSPTWIAFFSDYLKD
jgi:hypothetical protein